MACALGGNCAGGLCGRIVLLQLVIEDVVTCFLEHSVFYFTIQPFWLLLQ